MITAALDRELAAALSTLVANGELPAAVSQLNLAGTWRRTAELRPAAFATALPFELAELAGGTPAGRAAQLAERLRAAWLAAADAAGGYLTLTVTGQALAQSAAQMASAGQDCARSTILAGGESGTGHASAAVPEPWPDLAAAPGWEHAWQAQASAMTRRLAEAAGRSPEPVTDRERATHPPPIPPLPGGPLAAIIAYRGADLVRYRLARTPPGAVRRTAADLEALLPGRGQSQPPDALPGWPGPPVPDPLTSVREEQAAAAAVLRWSAGRGPSATSAGDLLATAAERELLTRLAFLPVRVAAAARRGRPDEVPRYLESVAAAWRDCRAAAPALLPRGRDELEANGLVSARLVLADTVRAVLAAGLALCGLADG